MRQDHPPRPNAIENSEEVQQFLRSLPKKCAPIVRALRREIIQRCPDVKETVLWGALSYHRPKVGGRVKGAVCLIHVVEEEVRLEFIHGVRLRDPQGLLQGDRRSKRYVIVHTREEATADALVSLVMEASRLDPSLWKPEGKELSC